MTIIVFLAFPLKTDIDNCANHPCKNNETCTDRVNGFNCNCAPGFNGTQCEIGYCSQNSIFPSYFRDFESLVSNIFPANAGKLRDRKINIL